MIGRLETAIKNAAKAETRNVHTTLPGKVVSYDEATQTAKIELLVQKRLRDPETGAVFHEAFPLIPDVPVAFPSGGGMCVTFPLDAGDPVVVVFAERSIAEWKASSSNSAQEPFDTRRHDVADAIAIPGGPSPSRALGSDSVASGLVLGEQGALGLQLRITGGQVAIGTPAVELLEQVVDALGHIVTALNTLSADVVPTAIGPQKLVAFASYAAAAASVGVAQSLIESIRGAR